jgi:hypothetical protein
MPGKKKGKKKGGKKVCTSKATGKRVSCARQRAGKKAAKNLKKHTAKRSAASKGGVRVIRPIKVTVRSGKKRDRKGGRKAAAPAKKLSMSQAREAVKRCKSPLFNNLASKRQACSCVATTKTGKKMVVRLKKSPCSGVRTLPGKTALKMNRAGSFNR